MKWSISALHQLWQTQCTGTWGGVSCDTNTLHTMARHFDLWANDVHSRKVQKQQTFWVLLEHCPYFSPHTIKSIRQMAESDAHQGTVSIDDLEEVRTVARQILGSWLVFTDVSDTTKPQKKASLFPASMPSDQIIHESLGMMILNHQQKQFLQNRKHNRKHHLTQQKRNKITKKPNKIMKLCRSWPWKWRCCRWPLRP